MLSFTPYLQSISVASIPAIPQSYPTFEGRARRSNMSSIGFNNFCLNKVFILKNLLNMYKYKFGTQLLTRKVIILDSKNYKLKS